MIVKKCGCMSIAIIRKLNSCGLALCCLALSTSAMAADDATTAQPKAFDEICTRHMQDKNPATHDPKIQERVQLFALQLLAGDPRFAEQWTKYNQELRKGTPHPSADAPDVANADIRQLDAAIDLHCHAPLEARLIPDGKGGLSLDIDDWRSYVFASIDALQKGQYTPQQAADLMNKVRPEDRKEAAEDFSRCCFLARIGFEATTKSDGTIVVSPKTTKGAQ
jgi:hypothetical protein